MRKLTEREIELLVEQGCSAENWLGIEVEDDDFRVDAISNVNFYGSVSIGGLSGTIEVEEGFEKRCGIHHATLRNVSIGSDCLIEKVNGYISNYDIADGVYISNVGVLNVQGTPLFGNGTEVAVLNEGGDENVVLYDKLTAQIAQLMLDNKAVRQMALREVSARPRMEHGTIGKGARIVGLRNMNNVLVGDACDIEGASCLTESTILSSEESPTFIGPDVILESSIVAEGATVTDGAKVYSSFVGESVHVGKGFSSEASVFFANAYMDNGESCAAFCGPFATSHHKSTLLIGGEFSFYNAGSNTNQSNHAYKMGPIHYGVLERGAKTASGSHILWPAQIGSFSMVMGKLTQHPDLRSLPFSYVMASEGRTYVVPGINVKTVGTWRDVNKWPKRDLRPRGNRKDLINFDFPNPFIIQSVLEGKKVLEKLVAEEDGDEFVYQNCRIKRSAAVKGIRYYDLAIKLFIRQVLNSSHDSGNDAGADRWVDVCGLLAPQAEIQRIVDDVTSGAIGSTEELTLVLQQIHADYAANAYDYAQQLMQNLGGSMFIDMDFWLKEAEEAYESWLHMVRDDAEHEYQLGDVSEEALREFLAKVK